MNRPQDFIKVNGVVVNTNHRDYLRARKRREMSRKLDNANRLFEKVDKLESRVKSLTKQNELLLKKLDVITQTIAPQQILR